MSRPEDKTLNSVRLLSDKPASENQGSIVTLGGISVGKNIYCKDKIIAEDLIVKNSTKIAGDLSIGGTLYCPGLYSVNNDCMLFRRNLVPLAGVPNCCLGTIREPWAEIHVGLMEACSMATTSMCVGPNSCGSVSISADPEHVTINNNFNIIDPTTNTLMLQTREGIIDAFAPIYQQWNSIRPIKILYTPGLQIPIATSNILLDTSGCYELNLFCDAELVPESTKVTIHFLRNNQFVKARYVLNVKRCGQVSVFNCDLAKKIKLIFLDKCVYLV